MRQHPHGFIDGEYQDGELRGLVFLAGMRGYGKTTEMGRLLSLCRGRVVLFDPLSSHTFPGFVVATQPVELKHLLRRSKTKILYQPRAGDIDEHFRAVSRIVYLIGETIYGVDEIDGRCGAHWGNRFMPPELYDIVNYGRHHKVSMVFTAREPMQIARGLTSASHEMRLFHMHENRYVKYFAEFIGNDAADRLRTLPKFQYLRWLNDGSVPQAFIAGRLVGYPKKVLGKPVPA